MPGTYKWLLYWTEQIGKYMAGEIRPASRQVHPARGVPGRNGCLWCRNGRFSYARVIRCEDYRDRGVRGGTSMKISGPPG